MELKLDDIVDHLQKVKTTHGQEAYDSALKLLIKQLLANGEGVQPFIEKILGKLEESLDLDALKTEADDVKKRRADAQAQAQAAGQSTDLHRVMIDSMRQQMPGLKTQAQFDLVMRGFEALQLYLDAAFSQDEERMKTVRPSLEQVLDLAPKLGVVAEQLEDNPDAATNTDFVEAPKQFTEVQTQQELMEELERISSLSGLNDWYQDQRERMDTIVDTKLRNALFDAIRAKMTQGGL